jgi:F420-dependent oxidoreductase-like protein
MRIGLQIPNFSWPDGAQELGVHLGEIARTAEDGGFYSLWVMDHYFQIGGEGGRAGLGPAEDEMLEGYSCLAFMAAQTRKVKLGTMVTGVVYRYPGVLVKTVTTLDVLSGGRAYLGIGAAWFEREARGLGMPFPPLKERFERLEETLQIAQQMWSPNNGDYHGKHYQLEETLCNPQPLSKPHPPILIGGGGEKKTLRLVAKYADACNLFARMDPAQLKAKLDALKQHCQEEGRDYNKIEKTALSSANLRGGEKNVQEIIDHIHLLAGLGFQHVIFNMPDVEQLKPLDIFARQIIPEVSGL